MHTAVAPMPPTAASEVHSSMPAHSPHISRCIRSSDHIQIWWIQIWRIQNHIQAHMVPRSPHRCPVGPNPTLATEFSITSAR
mmetsp:Transcript_37599/g.94953  ORF Transcript_37599/g.94953 Transcript_37599/m.94953 type:complete len:82 (+) Transcript_37599:164-409(+)